MSRLSDLIHEQLATEPKGQKIDHRKTAETVFPKLAPEDVTVLAKEGLAARVKATMTRVDRAAGAGIDERQLLFPGLHRGYAVDDDDERGVVRTRDLSESQFIRAIEIRRKQVRHDVGHIDEMEGAYRLLRPIWKAYPEFSFGQAHDHLAAQAVDRVAAE